MTRSRSRPRAPPGPFKVNGVPLRRVSQAYVIATSTKIDLTGVKLSDKLSDDLFVAHKVKKPAASELTFFSKKQGKKVSRELVLPVLGGPLERRRRCRPCCARGARRDSFLNCRSLAGGADLEGAQGSPARDRRGAGACHQEGKWRAASRPACAPTRALSRRRPWRRTWARASR